MSRLLLTITLTTDKPRWMYYLHCRNDLPILLHRCIHWVSCTCHACSQDIAHTKTYSLYHRSQHERWKLSSDNNKKNHSLKTDGRRGFPFTNRQLLRIDANERKWSEFCRTPIDSSNFNSRLLKRKFTWVETIRNAGSSLECCQANFFLSQKKRASDHFKAERDSFFEWNRFIESYSFLTIIIRLSKILIKI